MSNDKQPEIRFPGFAEDWKQRKLIEGVSKIGDGLHGTPSYSEDGDVFFINGNNLVNGKISITKETKFVNESDQSKDDKSLNVNTILMSINGTIGNLAWYNNEKVMLGKSIAYLTVSDFDKNFVYFYLQTPMMRKYFISNLTGTTIKNLGLKTIRNTELFVADLDEQQKIGSFFKQLDDTIALHQRKLDLLKETKKGFLQKMFPKNGAKVPEIRFSGFTEDWEERRLQEVVDRYDNLRIPITASKRVAGNTPYYGANGIQGYVEGYTHDGEFILVAEDGANDLKNYPVQYVDGKVWVNNHAHVIQAKENLADNMFLMNAIRSINIEPFLVGGGRAKLNADVLMKLEVIMPLKSEQQKIGAFFKQLDDTIALHQRKLDLLKETKKGFLQKMFV
ncbi:MAG: restriction endonuclease subunit S [Enterococcus hirae]|nr:restriction endonuclease subunit S [Enterococcus hirae]